MAMVVKNNMSAIHTLNTLNKNSSALQKSLGKVSSGMKINSAQDDASGYAISEKMRVQIRSLDQANQNTQNDSAMMKTAEGAVNSTIEILKSLKEKAINAANDSNTDGDRATIQKEIDQFIDQIDDNALTTFNGKYLVDGSKNNAQMATKSAYTNQSLGTDTTASSALTQLTNRSGESLEIVTSDYVTASFVKDGRTYSTTLSVANGTPQSALDVSNSASTDGAVSTDNAPAAGSVMSLDDVLTKLGDEYIRQMNLATGVSGAASPFGAPSATAMPTVTTTTKTGGTGSTTTTAATYSEVGAAADAVGTALRAHNDYAAKFDDVINEVVTAYKGTSGSKINAYDYKTGTQYKDLSTSNASTFDGMMGSDDVKAAIASYESTRDSYNSSISGAVATDGEEAADTNYAATDWNDTKVIGLNKFGDTVTTPDGTPGLTITAADSGVAGQIAGITFSITDSQGNVKKAANAALDQFKETIRAENKTPNNSLNFQVGAAANQSIKVSLTDMRSEALGLKGSDNTKLSVATKEYANAAVNVIDNALQKAIDQQTTIGSIESRLDYTSSNLTTSSENVQSAESTIRDADMAKEMTEYTKNNVLLQAAQSMLAQANQNSSAVLSLLQ